MGCTYEHSSQYIYIYNIYSTQKHTYPIFRNPWYILSSSWYIYCSLWSTNVYHAFSVPKRSSGLQQLRCRGPGDGILGGGALEGQAPLEGQTVSTLDMVFWLVPLAKLGFPLVFPRFSIGFYLTNK